jgi:hypothetical protein
VAVIAGCDRNDVCVVERAGFLVDGECSKLSFRYDFNSLVDDAMTSLGVATFDRNRKAWDIPNSKQILEQLDDLLSFFFKCVVDISTVSIYENSVSPTFSAETLVAFSPMPYYEPVDLEEVKAAIVAVRPQDEGRIVKTCIHDGEQFWAWESGPRWTRMPFVLVRYSIGPSSPRYVGYSVLTKSAEFLIFVGHGDLYIAALARFRDACRIAGTPGFASIMPAGESRYEGGMLECQGGFSRFQPALDVIQEAIPGVKMAPLCSDYMSLTMCGRGRDSFAHGCIAYVVSSGAWQPFVTRVAAYFGYDEFSYPVVFSRQFVDEWAADFEKAGMPSPGMVRFFHTVGHELAHLFAEKRKRLFRVCDLGTAHSVGWSIWADLITLLLLDYATGDAVGLFVPSHRQYSQPAPKTAEAMAEICVSDGLRLLQALRSRRSLSLDCLCEAYLLCEDVFEERYGRSRDVAAMSEQRCDRHRLAS